MKSSYIQNNYNLIFKTIVFLNSPKKIVEIGILDGFSLEALCSTANKQCQIYAYDLFEDYEFSSSVYDDIELKFSKQKNVHIKKADYKNIYKFHSDNSIDILHIDISNNGDTYEYCLNKYMPKISQGGIVLLEGGSEERAQYEWMNKFNFPKIRPIINKIKRKYTVHTLDAFPSLTIIKK